MYNPGLSRSGNACCISSESAAEYPHGVYCKTRFEPFERRNASSRARMIDDEFGEIAGDMRHTCRRPPGRLRLPAISTEGEQHDADTSGLVISHAGYS
jgi:hypothetical protein